MKKLVASVESFSEQIASFRMRIQYLWTIASIHRKFLSAESQKREETLRSIVEALRGQGFDIAVFVGGSLAFGRAIPESDFDILLIVMRATHDIVEVTDAFVSHLPDEFQGHAGLLDHTTVIVLPTVLTGVSQWEHIHHLYFEYFLCPLRLGFDCREAIDQIEESEFGRSAVRNFLPDVLAALDSKKDFWMRSFEKYRVRLQQQWAFRKLARARREGILARLKDLESKFFMEAGGF